MLRILIIFLISFIFSCRGQDSGNLKNISIDSLALDYNNQGVKLLARSNQIGENKNQLLDSALFLFDKGIELDKNFIALYINKSQVLRKKSQFTEAIEVLDIVLRIKPNYPEVIMGKGFLFEKLNMKEDAAKSYIEARDFFLEQSMSNPNSVTIKCNSIFALYFVEGKVKALEQIDKLIVEYPESSEAFQFKTMLEEFDRQEFINEY
jgi:tetratricopeptide (TPR) repeat protein